MNCALWAYSSPSIVRIFTSFGEELPKITFSFYKALRRLWIIWLLFFNSLYCMILAMEYYISAIATRSSGNARSCNASALMKYSSARGASSRSARNLAISLVSRNSIFTYSVNRCLPFKYLGWREFITSNAALKRKRRRAQNPEYSN